MKNHENSNLLIKIEKHPKGNNKPQKRKDGYGGKD